eukprot:5822280-Pyramimonas_sp.AAC.1
MEPSTFCQFGRPPAPPGKSPSMIAFTREADGEGALPITMLCRQDLDRVLPDSGSRITSRLVFGALRVCRAREQGGGAMRAHAMLTPRPSSMARP